tara:strand:- start:491 stop:1195 length:705 start_codon:yes stop_codon:yes gene_type:complete
MIEEFDIETYLYISSNEFQIYLFNKKNLKNLYSENFKFNNKNNLIDFNNLDKFLANNIFKIEKVAGSFIKNILLVIENDYINELNFGIKKKNYEKNINKKFLENILKDAKDLFRENYQKYKIIHILISRYLENGNYHSKFNNEFKGDYLCVEFEFKYISSELTSKISKVLGKYQIDLAGCLDSQYIKNYFSKEKLEFSEMIYKIHNGCNENEVKLIPKNSKKLGFFEKFFRFFS